MPTQLDPTGNPVEIEGVILRTPGLEGVADAHLGGSAGMRAAEETTQAMETAMATPARMINPSRIIPDQWGRNWLSMTSSSLSKRSGYPIGTGSLGRFRGA